MRGVIEPGVEPGLEAIAYYGPPYGATGDGSMAMIVEVDPRRCGQDREAASSCTTAAR